VFKLFTRKQSNRYVYGDYSIISSRTIAIDNDENLYINEYLFENSQQTWGTSYILINHYLDGFKGTILPGKTQLLNWAFIYMKIKQKVHPLLQTLNQGPIKNERPHYGTICSRSRNRSMMSRIPPIIYYTLYSPISIFLPKRPVELRSPWRTIALQLVCTEEPSPHLLSSNYRPPGDQKFTICAPGKKDIDCHHNHLRLLRTADA